MATVLQIKNGSTTYSFSHREVPLIKVETLQEEDLQILANGKPIVYTTSAEYNIISIDFNPGEKPSLYATLYTLADVENLMELTTYYRNGTAVQNFSVKIDPRINFIYKNGSRSTEYIRAIFYQASELISAIEYNIFPIGGMR